MTDRIEVLEREIQELRERVTAIENASDESLAMIMGTFDIPITEAHILAHLLKRQHSTRQMIIDSVWGLHSEPPTGGTLNVHLFRLRSRLKERGVTLAKNQKGTISLGPSTRRQISKMLVGEYTRNIHVVEIRTPETRTS